MNPDQRYDEDREQAIIDAEADKEAAALELAFREYGQTVTVARYPSTHIMGIDLAHEDIAGNLSPAWIAEFVTKHTGHQWGVKEVRPNYRTEAGDHGYPNLPFKGLHVLLTRAL